MPFSIDTLIKDIIAVHPDAADVFERHGLGCAHCLAASMETLAQAAVVHDISAQVLLAELNDLDEPVSGGELL
ncbi:MAG: DUF1858 domain-containing protein [Coriobacteriia bacterium]|nr:DUF1858 domain-containing protein [Coriobacteriia bacterium]